MKNVNVRGITSAVLLMSLAACGGGQGKQLGGDHAKNVCKIAGDSVVCPLGKEEIADDCTIFVGNDSAARPVAAEVTKDSVIFLLDEIEDAKANEVSVQCGVGERNSIGTLTLPKDFKKVADNRDDAVDPKPGVGSNEGDVVVYPEDPGSSNRPSRVPPAVGSLLDLKDLLQGSVPSAGSGATIHNFDVLPVSDGVDNFMTLKLAYNVTGKNAYIYGNIFNRKPGDTCETGFLVTSQVGKNLQEGTDLFKTYEFLATGKKCDANNSTTDDDCVMSDDAYPSGEGRDPKFNDQTVPLCRLDLIKANALVTSGEFYTRSYARFGEACLAVQGFDDQWTVTCRSRKAPDVEATVEKMKIATDSHSVNVRVTFRNAVYPPRLTPDKFLCVVASMSMNKLDGSGYMEWRCHITKGAPNLTLKAYGVGDEKLNQYQKQFQVNVGEINLTFRFKDPSEATGHSQVNDAGCNDVAASCPGTVEFFWKVSRTYSITDAQGNNAVMPSSGGEVSADDSKKVLYPTFWADKVELYQGGDLVSTVKIEGEDTKEGTIVMTRNRDIEQWKAKAYDFAAEYPVFKEVFWRYDPLPYFRLTNITAVIDGGPHACDDLTNARLVGTVEWEGIGIGRIEVTCTGTHFGPGQLLEVTGIKNDYSPAKGTIVTTGWIGDHNDTWATSYSCHLTVYDIKGKAVEWDGDHDPSWKGKCD